MQQVENSPSVVRATLSPPEWLVVIGANTGGPQALSQILPNLPADLPATFVVVQHMRPGFTRVLANQLNYLCKLPVYEPEDGQALQTSRILMVPAGHRLTLEDMGEGASIALEDVRESHEWLSNRTNDTMAVCAKLFGRKTVGVLLTGTGDDGREGMRAVAEAGGVTIAQDEATSIVHDLPASAISAGVVHETVPLWRIAERITQLVMGEADAVAA